MTNVMTGLTISMEPLYETPGDGGGGGGTPTGGATSFGPSTPGGAPASNAPAAEPQVYDLSDDNALIKIKGSDKPVKFTEHVRGLQSQFTKASQKAAQLEKANREYQAKLQDYEQRQQQAQRQSQGGNDPSNDVYAQLEALPYMSGKDAANVVRAIAGQIQQRDTVLLGTLKQLKRMEGIVNKLSETHSNSSFDSKINRWLTDGGYSTDYADLAKEVYLAYEGENLDEEFPQIFASRVDQIRKAFESERTAKVNAARKMPFVPGRGGQGTPSKPLQLDPRASAKQIADDMWNRLNNESET